MINREIVFEILLNKIERRETQASKAWSSLSYNFGVLLVEVGDLTLGSNSTVFLSAPWLAFVNGKASTVLSCITEVLDILEVLPFVRALDVLSRSTVSLGVLLVGDLSVFSLCTLLKKFLVVFFRSNSIEFLCAPSLALVNGVASTVLSFAAESFELRMTPFSRAFDILSGNTIMLLVLMVGSKACGTFSDFPEGNSAGFCRLLLVKDVGAVLRSDHGANFSTPPFAIMLGVSSTSLVFVTVVTDGFVRLEATVEVMAWISIMVRNLLVEVIGFLLSGSFKGFGFCDSFSFSSFKIFGFLHSGSFLGSPKLFSSSELFGLQGVFLGFSTCLSSSEFGLLSLLGSSQLLEVSGATLTGSSL